MTTATPPERVGLIAGLSNDDYHADSAVGSSGLKLIDQSPLHYWHGYLNPDRQRSEPTAAQKIGTATHTAILEPALFDDLYTAIPEGLDRRSKEGKEIWASIIESGKTPLAVSEIDRIMGMVNAVHAHPLTKVLFSLNPRFEQSFFWVDHETGVRCKVRPDMMIMPCEKFPNGIIVDLKTTEDASPKEFGRSAWNYDMHLQAALYPEGFMSVLGTNAPPTFFWLAVEKSAPHAPAYHVAGGMICEYGQREVNRLRSILADCQRTNKWAGYPTTASPLELPAYATRVIEEGSIAP